MVFKRMPEVRIKQKALGLGICSKFLLLPV
jgi:hypothetical protein